MRNICYVAKESPLKPSKRTNKLHFFLCCSVPESLKRWVISEESIKKNHVIMGDYD